MTKKAAGVSWWSLWEWSQAFVRWLDSGEGLMIMINRVTIRKWVVAAAALNWHLWLKTSTTMLNVVVIWLQ